MVLLWFIYIIVPLAQCESENGFETGAKLRPWQSTVLYSDDSPERLESMVVYAKDPSEKKEQLSNNEYNQDCKIVYDVTTVQQCSPVTEKVCASDNQVKTENVCKIVREKVCQEVRKQVPERKCPPIYQQKCFKEARQIRDVMPDSKCHDISIQVCEESGEWKGLEGFEPEVSVQPDAEESSDVQGISGLRALALIKRGVEGPKNVAPPRCRGQVRRICIKKPPVAEQRQQCYLVPIPVSGKCRETVRDVTETVCRIQPREVCSRLEVGSQCQEVTRQVCKNVPQKVARKICKDSRLKAH